MSSLSPWLLVALGGVLVLGASFLGYLGWRYIPIIGRIFEERPLFRPRKGEVVPVGGEDVDFEAADGVRLRGTYYRSNTPTRAGILVFCHEFLGDRSSFVPYVGYVLDHGFDVFSFDFRHHGESDEDADYSPLQWVTRHEVRDIRGALRSLRSRADRDPAGYVLFGVSRGGGAALCAAAKDANVWGLITDGAFPTHLTMMAYINRWAKVWVRSRWLAEHLPRGIFALLATGARMRSQWRLGCRYSRVERAARRLAPRPWLAIHGAKDNYIPPPIAEEMMATAGKPKMLWLVPEAKHNGGIEVDPEGYRRRVLEFLRQYGPRGVVEAPVTTSSNGAAVVLAPVA